MPTLSKAKCINNQKRIYCCYAPIHSLGEQTPSHPRPFRGDGLRILNQLAAKRVKINSLQQRVQQSQANLKKLSPIGQDQMQMRLLLGQGMKAKATHHNRASRFPSMYIYSPQQ